MEGSSKIANGIQYDLDNFEELVLILSKGLRTLMLDGNVIFRKINRSSRFSEVTTYLIGVNRLPQMQIYPKKNDIPPNMVHY